MFHLRRAGPTAPAGCRACGACCERYARTLAATEGDLARWRAEGRLDLLSRVGRRGELWLEPATGARLASCPFLDRLGPASARCSIHATKPEVCRAYPTEVHAFRCLKGVQFPLTAWWASGRFLVA